MQFKRNRRLMLAQDIVLVLLIPILSYDEAIQAETAQHLDED